GEAPATRCRRSTATAADPRASGRAWSWGAGRSTPRSGAGGCVAASRSWSPRVEVGIGGARLRRAPPDHRISVGSAAALDVQPLLRPGVVVHAVAAPVATVRLGRLPQRDRRQELVVAAVVDLGSAAEVLVQLLAR